MSVERALASCLALAALLGPACAMPAPTKAAVEDCDRCHAALTRKKVVHGAVPMGCATCHPAMDSASPHQSKGTLPKGLSKDPVSLCHDCHEQKLFEGKVVHAPIATGTCILCHDPHASDHLGLLRKAPAAQCLECHAEVAKGPHVVAGFSRAGHPLGEESASGTVKEDPLRPGRPFYCVSCHEPHRSELPLLVRVRKSMDSCQKCHRI